MVKGKILPPQQQNPIKVSTMVILSSPANVVNLLTIGEEKGEGEGSNEAASSTSEAVGQKALDSAKHFGSFLSSVANKAGATISATAKQLKHTVESNVSITLYVCV